MKNPKKLKRRHKEFLAEQGLDHHNFLIITDLVECYEFFYKPTRRVVNIRR